MIKYKFLHCCIFFYLNALCLYHYALHDQITVSHSLRLSSFLSLSSASNNSRTRSRRSANRNSGSSSGSGRARSRRQAGNAGGSNSRNSIGSSLGQRGSGDGMDLETQHSIFVGKITELHASFVDLFGQFTTGLESLLNLQIDPECIDAAKVIVTSCNNRSNRYRRNCRDCGAALELLSLVDEKETLVNGLERRAEEMIDSDELFVELKRSEPGILTVDMDLIDFLIKVTKQVLRDVELIQRLLHKLQEIKDSYCETAIFTLTSTLLKTIGT